MDSGGDNGPQKPALFSLLGMVFSTDNDPAQRKLVLGSTLAGAIFITIVAPVVLYFVWTGKEQCFSGPNRIPVACAANSGLEVTIVSIIAIILAWAFYVFLKSRDKKLNNQTING